jgi:hypothetical protein
MLDKADVDARGQDVTHARICLAGAGDPTAKGQEVER